MTQPASQPPAPSSDSDPRSDGKFSINEDWAATILGLVLLGACLIGLIPAGLIP